MPLKTEVGGGVAWPIDSSCRHRDLCSLVRLDPEFATDVKHDEAAHLIRAVSASEGQWTGTPVKSPKTQNLRDRQHAFLHSSRRSGRD